MNWVSCENLSQIDEVKWGFGLMCHMITPSIPALPIHVFWTSYVFLKEYSCESHLVALALANNMVFSLKFVLLCQIYVYLNAAPQKRLWGQLKPILPNYRYCYIRCNFKTGSVRFSMCHLIFWPNFSIIDQHLVLVWCNLHVFLTIFTALYGWNNLFSEM